MAKQTLVAFLFSFKGRFGRLNYINMMVCYILVFLAVSACAAIFMEAYEDISWRTKEGKILISFIALVFLGTIRVKALRLHDLELSGLFAPVLVLFTIPLVILETVYVGVPVFSLSAVLIVEILFMSIPGNTDENRFGLPNIEGKKTGLVIFCMLTLIVSVLALIGMLV